MKLFKLAKLWMLAFGAVFVLTACPDDGDDSDPPLDSELALDALTNGSSQTWLATAATIAGETDNDGQIVGELSMTLTDNGNDTYSYSINLDADADGSNAISTPSWSVNNSGEFTIQGFDVEGTARFFRFITQDAELVSPATIDASTSTIVLNWTPGSTDPKDGIEFQVTFTRQ